MTDVTTPAVEIAELLPERQVEVLADVLAELSNVSYPEAEARDIIEVLRARGYVVAQLAE